MLFTLRIMSTVNSQSYVFDPRPNYPLLITAKRYWRSNSKYLNDSDALTLVFTHGTGFHTEQWEPTIDDLYALLDNKTSVKVREVWGIDAPNHGDAAVLNEKALKWGYDTICLSLFYSDFHSLITWCTVQWEEYGRSIHAFLAGLGTGVDVNFNTRRLVGIGHSMGAVCL